MAETNSGDVKQRSVWLIGLIKSVIILTAFLAPIIYLPFTTDPLLAKATLVEVAAVVALAAWLLNVFIEKRLGYKRAPLNAAFLALAVMLLAATIFSRAPWASFWGSDLTGEKTATLLSFLALSFVIAAIFRREDVKRISAVILTSFLLLGIFTMTSILAGRMGVSLPGWLAINPAGTVNALALTLAAGFIFGLTLALTRFTSLGERVLGRRMEILAIITPTVLFAALTLIGFRMMWIGITAVMMLFIALSFTKSWQRGAKAEYVLSSTAAAIVFLILALSLFLSFRPLPLASKIFQPPLEISPTFKATLTIGAKVMKVHPAFGLGPANFRLAFNQFRDPAINNTIFWQTRFTHGFSFISTLLSTTGILGLVVFLGFAAMSGMVIARALWKSEESDPLLWALASAAVFILLEWFIYSSNFTLSFLLFIFMGMIAALAQEGRASAEVDPVRDKPRRDVGAAAPPQAERTSDGVSSWWRISRRSIIIDAPALNFAVSLVTVFAAAFSLVALYGLGTQYAAEVYANRAIRVLNLYGNTDSAKIFMERAIALNPKSDVYHQGRAQAALVAVSRIIAQAAANTGQDLSGQFRAEFAEGVGSAQQAAELFPDNPDNWFLLGQLYETVIPFIPGADRAAADAYERAAQADPLNPALKFAKARVGLAGADIAALQLEQVRGEDRERLDGIRADALKQARQELDSALALKADYAQAHFLAAQIALRENNIREAIAKTEDTARLAPSDIGVAFQLGVLYYRAERLDSARAEFERALLINENYSNARYFLGLIYDRRGDRGSALSQFRKVAALNPDNEEVRRIISNLEAGRGALENIAPPSPAPERRREAPVK